MNDLDLEGEEILNAISEAKSFNKWMYSQLEPYASHKTLEIGSGIGNISQFLIENNKDLVLSDLRVQYIISLEQKFPNNRVIQLNLVDYNFEEKYKDHLNKYDLVFALNVIEHIEDDKLAMENINKLLKPGGFSFILVPSYQFLFNHLDKSLEHFRRYNKKKLMAIMPKDFKTINTYYFNFVGIFGWFLTGTILGKKTIPKSNMRLYNKLVPLFKIIDAVLLNKVGLSVINISQKKL